ncbi:MAG: DUF1501 domain-containing protein [Planctomycetota bacterium]
MSPTRRQFLAGSSAFMGAAALGLSPRALAQALRENGTPPTLVCVYLRGGCDPINTIVPAGDPEYYNIRPTIGIPARSDDPENPAVLPVSNMFGFHPAMSALKGLYDEKKLAVMLNTGSTHPTRSHFDAQDFMERAAPGVKSVTEGWLNRYLQMTSSDNDRMLRAVAMQPVLPRALRGDYPVLAVPTGGADRAMRAFERLYSCDDNNQTQLRQGQNEPAPQPEPAPAGDGPRLSAGPAVAPEPPKPEEHLEDHLIRSGAESIEKLRHLQGVVRGARGGGNYPDGHLSRQLQMIAKVIKAGEGLEVAQVDYNGWDHHAYQGGSQGTQANMLQNLSDSLKAFHDDLGPDMDKTLVLVMTEFGRTVRENGTNGTDHGHGGFMLALGGMVKGGNLYGEWRGLERGSLYQGRDLPVSVDFRLVFAETLYALFGFHADQTDFFPEYKANDRPVGFLHPISQG